MKILQINSVFGRGSTGRIAEDIHAELVRKGISSYVIYGRGSYNNAGNIFRVSNKFFLYVDVVLTRLTGFIGYFSPFATFKTKKLINQIKPDVIHIHNIHGYYINISDLIKYIGALRIPLIFTMHDEFLYTGKCAYTEKCERYLIGCGNCPLVQSYPKSLIFDFSRTMFNTKRLAFESIENLTFVSPSEWLANKTRHTHLGNNRVMVINNGIDLNRFIKFDKLTSKSKLGLEEKNIVLTVIANIDDNRKGAFWLEYLSYKINQNIVILCVGNGDSKVDRENVVYLKPTNDVTELSSYYSAADSFVILSQYENYPTVCLEASAYELPIFGFDIGGVEESINNVPYKLFEYGKVDDMAKSINEFFDSKSYTLNGSKKKDISKQKMLGDYLELYKEVLSEN